MLSSSPPPRRLRRILLAAAGAIALSVSLTAGVVASTASPAAADTAYQLPSGRYAGRPLYVDPDTTAAAAAEAAGGTDAVLNRLAATPQATWLVGGDPASTRARVQAEVAAAARSGAVTQFVVYDLPNRDCSGGQSAGGAAQLSAYQDYVSAVSRGLAGAHAFVVLEPDALADLDCLAPDARTQRLALLKWAVRTLVHPGVQVYLDAGHAGWQSSATMAYRLIKAGIYYARGFALNVSNFDSTASETAYGLKISARVGWKRFLIDTSRNGSGARDGWCNPAGATLGEQPASAPSSRGVDALLWIKHPGESDGSCGTSTAPAGVFDTGLARALAG
jgi:endoglucanase